MSSGFYYDVKQALGQRGQLVTFGSDGAEYFAHTLEGPDDMPAHIKASLTGSSLTIPVSGGSLALGTWQGIYLCEHRDSGGPRRVVFTAFGDDG